ncbi:AraC-like DNA-binding protein [Pontibacter ummariensis]|uniref:Transcriptional regulator, AraC family n=1 Tax=Pontibacter ummariensis TaxID=1610492 RepID=A0A239LL88_9BACT|nr:helix-turn-helix domain-containing protein [Pontibacter ummariensis]PRY02934.1 AraC-like DNA-binding protein [Pontibacter ummariensis]SNT31437.1 transcriptional regulator, AraC family [Pontibacter ummariensis]
MTKQGATIPVYTEAESFRKNSFRDFYIASYEDRQDAGLKRVAPHRHTYYEIIWITEGSGTHTIDFKDYPFHGPCLFLLQPSHIHQIIKDGPTKGFVLKFNESLFAVESGAENLLLKYGIFDNINVQPVLQLDSEAVHLLNDLMQKMLLEYKNASELSAIIIASYLKVFLLQVYKLKDSHREELQAAPEPRYLVFRTFKMMLEQQYRQQHAVQYYAAALAITPRSLNEVTHKYAGRTVSDLIKERLMLEAKRLLHHGKLTIKEIAGELGFDDAAYFTRFFTKNEGLSPQNFRFKEKHDEAGLVR